MPPDRMISLPPLRAVMVSSTGTPTVIAAEPLIGVRSTVDFSIENAAFISRSPWAASTSTMLGVGVMRTPVAMSRTSIT